MTTGKHRDAGQRPLISFLLLAYNQEGFVRDAVSGALAQTYSPLEIVLSDDCSHDRTFEIMAEMVRSYTGPHRIVLNRNPKNVGICENLNVAARLAKGVLLVIAAADDISFPERCELTFEAWEKSDRRSTSICSRYLVIGGDGERIEEHTEATSDFQTSHDRWCHIPPDPLRYVESDKPHISGCAHAISPQLLNLFGPLPFGVVHEDLVLGLRSSLTGGVTLVNVPLVYYRRHGANSFCPPTLNHAQEASQFNQYRQQYIKHVRALENTWLALGREVRTAQKLGLISVELEGRLLSVVERRRRVYALRAEFHESGWIVRVRTWLQLLVLRAPYWILRDLIPFLLPECMCRVVLCRGYYAGKGRR